MAHVALSEARMRVSQMRSNRPQRLNSRAHMVWLWYKGLSVRDISHETGFSTTTIYRWIKRWQQEGHVYTKPRLRKKYDVTAFDVELPNVGFTYP
ncbi:hypothetical protein SK128_001426 [Halocaridina rubra]|uniref:Homeodomain-like domain-containing protein n=1 Tax=Halocaridina rubra TaxID=373956 RepID=A0AAN8XS48_HALRR